jgi:N-acetylmuramoyl-L-alanine amidase
MTGRFAVALVSVLVVVAPVPATAAPDTDARRGPLALDGRVVVIDPGHQLGNRNFPRRINRLVPAGGFRKPCRGCCCFLRGGWRG